MNVYYCAIVFLDVDAIRQKYTLSFSPDKVIFFYSDTHSSQNHVLDKLTIHCRLLYQIIPISSLYIDKWCFIFFPDLQESEHVFEYSDNGVEGFVQLTIDIPRQQLLLGAK